MIFFGFDKDIINYPQRGAAAHTREAPSRGDTSHGWMSPKGAPAGYALQTGRRMEQNNCKTWVRITQMSGAWTLKYLEGWQAAELEERKYFVIGVGQYPFGGSKEEPKYWQTLRTETQLHE